MVVGRDVPVLRGERGVAVLEGKLHTISGGYMREVVNEPSLIIRKKPTRASINTQVSVRGLDGGLALVNQPVLSRCSVTVIAAMDKLDR